MIKLIAGEDDLFRGDICFINEEDGLLYRGYMKDIRRTDLFIPTRNCQKGEFVECAGNETIFMVEKL